MYAKTIIDSLNMMNNSVSLFDSILGSRPIKAQQNNFVMKRRNCYFCNVNLQPFLAFRFHGFYFECERAPNETEKRCIHHKQIEGKQGPSLNMKRKVKC